MIKITHHTFIHIFFNFSYLSYIQLSFEWGKEKIRQMKNKRKCIYVQTGNRLVGCKIFYLWHFRLRFWYLRRQNPKIVVCNNILLAFNIYFSIHFPDNGVVDKYVERLFFVVYTFYIYFHYQKFNYNSRVVCIRERFASPPHVCVLFALIVLFLVLKTTNFIK